MAGKVKGNGVKSTPAPAKKFDPSTLNSEQQALVVEEYLGVHPKYFLYKGLNVQINMGMLRFDKKNFNGWKPKAYKYNSFSG